MVERLRAAYDEPRSARGRVFRRTVARWLDASPELLVLNRMAFGAGRKDWFLIRSLDDLDLVVNWSRPSDCLTVFSGHHLPVRGPADEHLLRGALEVVSSNEETVIGELVNGDPMLKDAFAAAPGDETWVEEWVRERWTRSVALGPYPPFLSDDPKDAVDAIVPTPDGSVVVAAY